MASSTYDVDLEIETTSGKIADLLQQGYDSEDPEVKKQRNYLKTLKKHKRNLHRSNSRSEVPITPFMRDSSEVPITPFMRDSPEVPITPFMRDSPEVPITPFMRDSSEVPITPFMRDSSNSRSAAKRTSPTKTRKRKLAIYEYNDDDDEDFAPEDYNNFLVKDVFKTKLKNVNLEYDDVSEENKSIIDEYNSRPKNLLYRALRPDEVLDIFEHEGLRSQCSFIKKDYALTPSKRLRQYREKRNACKNRSIKNHISHGAKASSEWISATSELAIAAKWAASAEGAILSNEFQKNKLSGVIAVINPKNLTVINTQHLEQILNPKSTRDLASSFAYQAREYLIYHFIPLSNIKLVQASVVGPHDPPRRNEKLITYSHRGSDKIDLRIKITFPPLNISRTKVEEYRRFEFIDKIGLTPIVYNINFDGIYKQNDIAHRVLNPPHSINFGDVVASTKSLVAKMLPRPYKVTTTI